MELSAPVQCGSPGQCYDGFTNTDCKIEIADKVNKHKKAASTSSPLFHILKHFRNAPAINFRRSSVNEDRI